MVFLGRRFASPGDGIISSLRQRFALIRDPECHRSLIGDFKMQPGLRRDSTSESQERGEGRKTGEEAERKENGKASLNIYALGVYIDRKEGEGGERPWG